LIDKRKHYIVSQGKGMKSGIQVLVANMLKQAVFIPNNLLFYRDEKGILVKDSEKI
jgi:hypothetical protein